MCHYCMGLVFHAARTSLYMHIFHVISTYKIMCVSIMYLSLEHDSLKETNNLINPIVSISILCSI